MDEERTIKPKAIYEKAYRAYCRAYRLPKGSEVWNVAVIEWDVYKETLQDLDLWSDYLAFCALCKEPFCEKPQNNKNRR